jgi:hypothetical protein
MCRPRRDHPALLGRCVLLLFGGVAAVRARRRSRSHFARLAGGGAGAAEEVMPAVEHKGYRIRPTPYLNGGQYQTADVIRNDAGDGVKEHRFIRAETHPSKGDAAAFAVTKGKQIIDQQATGCLGEGPNLL